MTEVNTIAVAGIKGSFSHQAGVLYSTGHGLVEPDFVFGVDSPGAFEAISTGKADVALVPIHNSIGGLVNMTLSSMGQHLFTISEYVNLQVDQCLMKHVDADIKMIQRIASHPQALKQCEQTIKANWPGVEVQQYVDTAKSAADVANGTLPPTTAAIAPRLSAELYGLELIEEGIQDIEENITTFLVVHPVKQV